MEQNRSNIVKYSIVVVLTLFIIVVAYYVGIHYDEMFTQKIEIRYPDNCVEVYMSGEIITPNCTTGRKMLEEQQERNKPEWMKTHLNITFP